ncbi:MAG: GIY-YIG nuclease family protein [Flavobacteriaceae bacterium]|nr:GIY-YIG nuclease family protein [Flavobacteriaceae bacterium]
MYFVYVLKSLHDGRLYKGMSQDVPKRLKSHNQGQTRSTKPYRPWILVYQEEFATRLEARAREKYFKSGAGREYLKSIIKNSF